MNKTNMNGIRGLKKMAAVFALAVTLGAGASVKADNMVLQWSDHNSGYLGSVEGITGAWTTESGWKAHQETIIGTYMMAMLKFNDSNGLGLGTITADYAIDQALLTLMPMQTAPGGTLYVAPVTSSWTEGYNLTEPTYNSSLAVSIAQPADTSSSLTIDVTSLVRAWHEGTLVNYGFIIYTDSSANRFDYRGGNYGYNGLNAPMLTIDYSVIPEPSSWALLSTGALLLAVLRRRRG